MVVFFIDFAPFSLNMVPDQEVKNMQVDPEREITLTIPFGMVNSLKKATPILAMFRDEAEVRAVIEIIDAIYAGAIEFIRQEEGDLTSMMTEPDSDEQYFVKPGDDEDEDKSN